MPRYCLFVLLLIAGMLAGTAPVHADVISVDPNLGPVTTVDEADALKIQTLQDVVQHNLLSSVSPDDAAVLIGRFGARVPDGVQLTFLNIQDGSEVPLQFDGPPLAPLTEVAWRDNRTAVYFSVVVDPELGIFEPVVVALDRITGAVSATPTLPPGFPFSLSPDGRFLLILLFPEGGLPSFNPNDSPFNQQIRRSIMPDNMHMPQFAEDREIMQVSSFELELAAFDLATGNIASLVSLPEGTAPISLAWSPDGSRLALVRTSFPLIGREGNLLHEFATQDGLGNLPPDQNPFLQNNVVDIFDLTTGDFRPEALRAAAGNGDTFAAVSWSTDSQTLLTQMQHPAQLVGRTHPVYLSPDRSYLRFYSFDGQLLNTFDHPSINAPTVSSAQFVSPDEVIINAVSGMNLGLFYYNRGSGEFRQLPVPDGSVFSALATNASRQLVFSFNSFQQPPELFRINWDGSGLAALTFSNESVTQANQIRADQVNFTLQNGAQRTGYLLQPAGAAFPPQDVPIIVWQEGGPGFYVGNRWSSNVESPFNLLPNLGYAMLVVPLPGREGFGPEFYNALADGTNFGQIDIDEAAEIVDQMIQRGYTSPGKLGITGCSYGGYFAVQSLVRHPDTYTVANTQCTLLDLYHEWQFGFTPFLSYLMGGTPLAIPAEYAQDAPFYNATQIQTPLLIFHGSSDFLPIQITSNFYDQVASQFTPVQYFRFEGEPHGLVTPTSQFIAAQAQLNWFREYIE